MANNLLKKGRTWYARLVVPEKARKILGRREFKKSLETPNYRRALARSGTWIDFWQQQIEAAKAGKRQEVEALQLKETLVQAEAEKNERDKQQLLEVIADAASAIEEKGATKWKDKVADDGTIIGREVDWKRMAAPTKRLRQESKTREDAERFYELAMGKRNALDEHLEIWLTELTIAEKTKDEYRTAFKELKEEFKDVEEVTRRLASEFVRKTLSPGRAVDTVGKKLSAYQGYWKWLIRHGYLSDELRNPWEGLKPKKTDKPTLDRRPFTEEEAAQMLRLVAEKHKKHPNDFAICQIATVTGLRLNEVASLKASDCRVDGDTVWLNIHDTKTKAGNRRVPVVEPEVVEHFTYRLEKRQGDEDLFERLVSDQYGKKSPALSNRFGRTLRSFTKDPALACSHSWRHRARTLLERGNISPWVSDWLIGHARPGEGFSRYSQGPSDEQLIEAAKVITLPKPKDGPAVECKSETTDEPTRKTTD